MPPAQAAQSLEQLEFRREVCAAAKSAFATTAAPGAVRTFEATLRANVPKVTANLGSSALPMSPEDVFYAFFSAAVMLGPKTASPVSVHPAGRWSYVKLVKAAAAYWHVVRGSRAVFDCEGSPRMGVVWSGIKRSCVHVSTETDPLLLSFARQREAVRNSDLPPTGSRIG